MTGTRDSLYVSRRKIQPRAAHGRYARLRVLAMLVLLGLYYVLPWLSIGGEPLVLLCLLYTSPSPRDKRQSRMPSSA